MEIRLNPEVEELIRKDIERGPYGTVEEYVEHAVSMLHEQVAGLAEHRTEIEAQIEEGYAESERGELIDGDEARAQIDEFKRSLRLQR